MINELAKKPDEAMVKMAEEFLERAKSGEIQSVAIAGVTGNGGVFNQFVGGFRTMALIGEMRLLERDIIDICCEVRRQVDWEFTE